jgi:hypothetical protein
MIKQLRTFFLFIVLFAMSSPLIGGSGIADKWAAGGWVSVKSQSNNKYEVTCNMLYAVDRQHKVDISVTKQSYT